MIRGIISLLELFSGHVPDTETHRWVLELARDESQWSRAHDVFDNVRERTLTAIAARNHRAACQYGFEEICLKSIFNETHTDIPFDSDSPYWIANLALKLGRAVNVSEEKIVEILAR